MTSIYDRINKNNLDYAVKTIDGLSNFNLQVGIFDNERASVLKKHSKGSKNLPKREVLENSIRLYKKDIKEKILTFAKSTNFKKKDAMYPVLNATGSYIAKNVVKHFIDNEAKDYLPPLKPLTIKRKGHNKMLRDTDKMYNALSHLVIKKK